MGENPYEMPGVKQEYTFDVSEKEPTADLPWAQEGGTDCHCGEEPKSSDEVEPKPTTTPLPSCAPSNVLDIDQSNKALAV
jgi:hypothetical protein